MELLLGFFGPKPDWERRAGEGVGGSGGLGGPYFLNLMVKTNFSLEKLNIW